MYNSEIIRNNFPSLISLLSAYIISCRIENRIIVFIPLIFLNHKLYASLETKKKLEKYAQ